MSKPCEMIADGIAALAEGLRRGEITSEGLVAAAVREIQKHHAHGGVAYVSVDIEQSLQRARESDRMRTAGYALSDIAGLPIAVTDAFDVEGQITRAASRARDDVLPAASDALVIARLKNAGAVLLGRTNMSEFALSCLGTNAHFGTPTLPMDSKRIVGGAGSGLAVAVAMGMAVAGVGTDTQGSIRIPAAFCGLTGFKPSANRISTQGVFPLSPTLDSVGSIARCVDDCALLDAVMSGERGELGSQPLAGLRLAVTSDYVLDGVHAMVGSAFKRVLRLLTDAGADIRWFEFPELDALSRINESGGFVAVEAWYQHRQFLEGAAQAHYDPIVVERLRQGQALSAYDYLDLLAERRRLIDVARSRLESVDAWLMPTVPISAPRLDELQHDRAGTVYFERDAQARRNTSVVNFLDGCAVTLPCQEPGDLPVGLSVVGLNGRDESILRSARAIETLLREATATAYAGVHHAAG